MSEVKEGKKLDKPPAHFLRPEEAVGPEGGTDTNCSWGSWNSPQGLVREIL